MYQNLCKKNPIDIHNKKNNINLYYHQIYILKDISMYPKLSKNPSYMHDNKILRMIL